MMEFFQSAAFLEAADVFVNEIPFAIWETLYSTVLATALAYLIGLPLGVLLVAGEKGGILPLPKLLLSVLNIVVNLLRSVPFLILIMLVIPLARIIVGTSVGTLASTIPLVIAAFPFVARLVEGSLREVDGGVIEAAQSMGASPLQMVSKVMLPECRPSLISGASIALTTILGYGAMSGIVGGGGLGMIAIVYGYNRYRYLIMVMAVVLIVILVQLFQMAGTYLSTKSDKRLNQTTKRRKKL